MPEAKALRHLEVEGLLVTVANGIHGKDLYHEGKARYRMV